MKDIISISICFCIGFSCKYFNIPLPAPIHITGVLMIVAIWAGYKVI